MRLTHLSFADFRNLESVALEPHPRFNVVVGANGQGKTNLLEGIYWLATLRSLRASRLRELARWGARACKVEGKVQHEGLEHRLAVGLEDGRRVAWREGKARRAADYFGALAAVVFTPDDVGLVRGPPRDRRAFLDRAVFTGRPAHLEAVLDHRRALDGRNRLLRDGAPDALLEVYEQTLAGCAARLMSARAEFLERLAPRFAAVYAAIAHDAEVTGGERASVAYRAGIDLDPESEPEATLMEAWAAERSRDRERGFTVRGAHTDDLNLRLGERSARLYASQGQQRAMVLALKIAEIELLAEHPGVHPILLLDDVSSELDPARNARLFGFLEAFQGQVFITSTDAAFLRIDAARKVWRVEAGRVSLTEE